MDRHPITPDLIPELAQWLEHNRALGCSPAQLRAALVAAGYRQADIDDFLQSQSVSLPETGRADVGDADPVASAEEAIGRFWRSAGILAASNRVDLGDRAARILTRQPAAGIYYLQDVLSDEECEGLIREGAARMSRSTVVDDADGAHVVVDGRSSRGAMLERGQSDLVRRIEGRLARLTGLPVDHGEGLQILHYEPGGRYEPHFDYFDPATAGGARTLAVGGQRLVTVVMYLCEVERGGGTRFPELALECLPVRGAALVFPSIGPDGALLPASLHAGAPVEAGAKWIATKWIRVQPYVSAAT